MDVHGHPVEPTTWRLTFSGPLNYDTLINNTPDVTEPFKLVKFWE